MSGFSLLSASCPRLRTVFVLLAALLLGLAHAPLGHAGDFTLTRPVSIEFGSLARQIDDRLRPIDTRTARDNRRGPPPVSFRLSFDQSHSTRSSFDDLPGGYRMWETSVEGGTRLVIRPGQTWDFSVGHRYTQFDFDATTLLPGRPHPFRELHTTEFQARYSHRVDPKWTISAASTISFDREESAHLADTTQAGLILGGTYEVTPAFRITPVLIVVKRLEEEVRVFPAAALTWQVHERLKVEVRKGLIVEAALDRDQTWFLSAAFRFDNRSYRLDSHGPARAGIAELNRRWLALELDHRPLPFFSVGGSIGWVFSQELKIKDRTGDRIGADDGEDSFLIGVRGMIRF